MRDQKELRMGKVWEISFRAGERHTGAPRLGLTPGLSCRPQPTLVTPETARCLASPRKELGSPPAGRAQGADVQTNQLRNGGGKGKLIRDVGRDLTKSFLRETLYKMFGKKIFLKPN